MDSLSDVSHILERYRDRVHGERAGDQKSLARGDVVVEEDMARYTQVLPDTAKGPECEAGVGGEGSLLRREKEMEVQHITSSDRLVKGAGM